MDESWLHTLDPTSAVIVPTRTLANHLNQQYSAWQIDQGRSVWQSPTILVWTDFVRLLWTHNLPAKSRLSLLTPLQSKTLWRQVIEASARDEPDLMLLNVPQTVRAVRRSWETVHDWLINPAQIRNDLAADSEQLLHWFGLYEQQLEKRFLIDQSQLASMLINTEIKCPFDNVIWYAYDLVTKSQQVLNQHLKRVNVNVLSHQPRQQCVEQSWVSFVDDKHEITATLRAARQYLEQSPDASIAIVIPDLEHRYRQVQDSAREVFYPALSPLQAQDGAAYRFSLGKPMGELPAIQAALSLIEWLNKPLGLPQIKLLLRSRYIRRDCAVGEMVETLEQVRLHRLSLHQISELNVSSTTLSAELDEFLGSALGLQQELSKALEAAHALRGFKTLELSEWLDFIQGWLSLWGWSTSVDGKSFSSEEFQLNDRWQGLIEELASLSLVQNRIGFSRLIETIKQTARDTIFLPKTHSAPIVISSVLEGSGRLVDQLYLTGMHQDYPGTHTSDAFIAKRLLFEAGHPLADAVSEFEHYTQLIQHLVDGAKSTVVSYAAHSSDDPESSRSPSALFADASWNPQEAVLDLADTDVLITYQDEIAPRVDKPSAIKGGARVFETQSNCPFKAFAEHRLKLRADDETEFGLDALDRGNVVHRLLETLWRELKSQSYLLSLSDEQLDEIIDKHIEGLLAANALNLNEEKRVLLDHERSRLKSLLLEWLEQDKNRPAPFTVVHRELDGQNELGGIAFRYVIDRVDQLEDGRRLVIDYKTGVVSRTQWLDDRLKSPQLPLYALSIDRQDQPIAGIAFAQTKRWESQYSELADVGIFRKADKRTQTLAETWQQRREAWPQIFESLADDFLSGVARVDPIDNQVCQYCDYSRLCRIRSIGEVNLEP